MSIYICMIMGIIILGLILKPNTSNKKKRIYLIIIFGLLTIVSAFRNVSVGVDTEQFCRVFDIVKNKDLIECFSFRYEKGFVVLCKILSFFSNNKQILIMCSSIIIVPLMGRFIYNNSKDVVLSSYIYICINIFAMQMNAMRQALAVAIILLGYDMLLKNNKRIRYIIVVIIASLFHSSALIMILLLFIKNKEYKKKYYFYTLIFGILALLMSNKIFSMGTSLFPQYLGYENSRFYDSSIIGGTISSIIYFIILTYGILLRKNKEYNMEAYIISILFVIQMMVIRINLFVRLTTYFEMFTCIWIPNATMLSTKIKNRVALKYIIYIAFFTYWLIIALYRPEWHGVVPYKFYSI